MSRKEADFTLLDGELCSEEHNFKFKELLPDLARLYRDTPEEEREDDPDLASEIQKAMAYLVEGR